jgi:hypothetical protein
LAKFRLSGLAMMKRTWIILMLLATLLAAPSAYGRGGQAADDCPPGSKDPDCAGSK